MNDDSETEKEESQRLVNGIFILAAALAFCIGLGMLAGAGVGWIAFGVFCVLVLAAHAQLAKGKKP